MNLLSLLRGLEYASPEMPLQEIKQDSLGFFRLKVLSVTYYPSMSVLFPFRFYDGVELIVSECAVVCRLKVAGLK